jgi:hypothetical protein
VRLLAFPAQVPVPVLVLEQGPELGPVRELLAWAFPERALPGLELRASGLRGPPGLLPQADSAVQALPPTNRPPSWRQRLLK